MARPESPVSHDALATPDRRRIEEAGAGAEGRTTVARPNTGRPWSGSVLTVLAVAVAFVVTWALRPVLDRNTFTVFLAAIVLAAVAGGVRQSVLAIVLSLIAAGYLVLNPSTSLLPNTLADIFALLTLAGVGVVVAWLAHGRRTAREKLAESDRSRTEAALRREQMRLDLEERRIQALLDVLPVGVWIADQKGHIVQTNAAARAIWGGEPPRSRGWEGYHEDYPAWWPDGTPLSSGDWALARAISDGEATGPEEIVIRTFGGQRRTILNYGAPIRDPEGRVVGAVALSVDITAQKQVEEDLQRAVARAEKANRAKTLFLSSMSHELRTPLNAIAGYVDLLDAGIRGPLSDRQREDLKRIKRAQEMLLALIEDVLSFAKPEVGRLQIGLEPVRVRGLLDDLEELVLPLMDEQGHRYVTRCEDPDLHVLADPERTRQILLNLASNAAKFTDPGGRITTSVEAHASRIRISVSDTGRGIPPEDLEKIFEPFVQLEAGLSPDGRSGVGLGLAIARELAQTMGGELSVESVEGEGTTFTLSLPNVSRGADATAAAASSV